MSAKAKMSKSYDPKVEQLARYFMADGEIQPEEAICDLAQTIQDAIENWFVGWNPLTGKRDLR